MTFQELLETVRKTAEETDVSQTDPMVVQVRIVGEEEGVFCVGVKDHQAFVDPEEHAERDCEFTLSMDDYVRLMDGKLNPVMAYMFGRLRVEGDFRKALEFARLLHLMK